MGLTVNTNPAALNAYRNLSNTQAEMSKSMEKLSSGLRINRAADDAAGLSISEGLRAQINGSNQAQRNAQDGISVIQTAEGALTEVHDILQRVRELTVQAGNDSNNAEARDAIAGEVASLGEELTRIAESTNFDGTKLLSGGATLTFQVGAGSSADEDQIGVMLQDFSGLGATIGALATTDSATALTNLDAIDTAISSVSSARSDLGAQQNRFESAIRSLSVSAENLSAAESRIRDTDMAQEMVKYSAKNIMSQAGTAMLAQANQSSQGVLQLLG